MYGHALGDDVAADGELKQSDRLGTRLNRREIAESVPQSKPRKTKLGPVLQSNRQVTPPSGVGR